MGGSRSRADPGTRVTIACVASRPADGDLCAVHPQKGDRFMEMEMMLRIWIAIGLSGVDRRGQYDGRPALLPAGDRDHPSGVRRSPRLGHLEREDSSTGERRKSHPVPRQPRVTKGADLRKVHRFDRRFAIKCRYAGPAAPHHSTDPVMACVPLVVIRPDRDWAQGRRQRKAARPFHASGLPFAPAVTP
jgi:hypothetical protein